MSRVLCCSARVVDTFLRQSCGADALLATRGPPPRLIRRSPRNLSTRLRPLDVATRHYSDHIAADQGSPAGQDDAYIPFVPHDASSATHSDSSVSVRLGWPDPLELRAEQSYEADRASADVQVDESQLERVLSTGLVQSVHEGAGLHDTGNDSGVHGEESAISTRDAGTHGPLQACTDDSPRQRDDTSQFLYDDAHVTSTPDATHDEVEQVRSLLAEADLKITQRAAPKTRQTGVRARSTGKELDIKHIRPPAPKLESEPSKPRERWAIQKAALEKKFGQQGWQPRKRISPDAIAGVRSLHASDPNTYSTARLAEYFQVSPESIRRILKSKWQPSEAEAEDRRRRWEKRGERKWTDMVEQGIRPPKKWREMGVGRVEKGETPTWKQPGRRERWIEHRSPEELFARAAEQNVQKQRRHVPLAARFL